TSCRRLPNSLDARLLLGLRVLPLSDRSQWGCLPVRIGKVLLSDSTLFRTNKIIEQDHRRIKERIRPMLGFKVMTIATITISGIEPAHKIKKGQFDLTALNQRAHSLLHQIWEGSLYGLSSSTVRK